MSVEPTGINWPLVYIWLFVAQWVFNIGLGAWVYFSKADSANARSVRKVSTDLDKFILASKEANEDQNTRITKLEETMKHIPTDEEIARIREDVASTKSRVEGMSDLLRRVEHQTTLIHEHLLRRV